MTSKPRRFDNRVSPVGWYVGTYQLRLVELDRPDIEDESARFLVWENTVLVKADSLDAAYDRVTAVAQENSNTLKVGEDANDAQWMFEGILDVVPIYEDLQDGCEIMWAERSPRTLKDIRSSAISKEDLLR